MEWERNIDLDWFRTDHFRQLLHGESDVNTFILVCKQLVGFLLLGFRVLFESCYSLSNLFQVKLFSNECLSLFHLLVNQLAGLLLLGYGLAFFTRSGVSRLSFVLLLHDLFGHSLIKIKIIIFKMQKKSYQILRPD